MVVRVGGKYSGKNVIDHISDEHPVPVRIAGSSIELDVSLSSESVYIDTRKGEWIMIRSSTPADTLPFDVSTIDSNSLHVTAGVNGLLLRVLFQNSGDSCYVIPAIADSVSSYVTFLPQLYFSGEYATSEGYLSTSQAIDIFGASYVYIYKTGCVGNVEILGLPY